MKHLNFLLLSFLLVLSGISAQDTFSIVAVDAQTGEVGSAGATCLDVVNEGVSALIISDMLPGRGAIHTQSFWVAQNQMAAKARMEEGLPPQGIIDWLVDNDVSGNPGLRQYGIADFDENGDARAAAFTGNDCFDYKGQRVGTYYAIQGNILLGPEILDSMEARFLHTTGSLAQRLMAAMQGANVPGADTRCLGQNVSSRSAFLRVARPGDSPDDLYLDLHVPSTPFAVEPINVLQQQFDEWLLTTGAAENALNFQIRIFPNPTAGTIFISLEERTLPMPLFVYLWDTKGRKMGERRMLSSHLEWDLGRKAAPGIYLLEIRKASGKLIAMEKVILD